MNTRKTFTREQWKSIGMSSGHCIRDPGSLHVLLPTTVVAASLNTEKPVFSVLLISEIEGMVFLLI
jgi:hypothetical protein